MHSLHVDPDEQSETLYITLSPLCSLYLTQSHVLSTSSSSSYSFIKVKTRASESSSMGAATVVDIILAILLPPVGVFLKFGCGSEFWICLILTILGYIPGIIYALYAITK